MFKRNITIGPDPGIIMLEIEAIMVSIRIYLPKSDSALINIANVGPNVSNSNGPLTPKCSVKNLFTILVINIYY